MNNNLNMELLHELIRVAKSMEAAGLVNTYEGNLSVKDENGLIYITPSRTRKSLLIPEEIAIIAPDGTQIGGTKKASTETIMHRCAYEYRPDAKSVIHCHAPYLTAYAICNKTIEGDFNPELLFHYKKIPCAPYGKPGTRDIIDNGADLIKQYPVILLGNHGVLAIGSTVEKAFQRIESAEKLARIISIINQIGTPVSLPQDEIERLMNVHVDL